MLRNLNSYTSILGYTSISITLNRVFRKIRFTHVGNRTHATCRIIFITKSMSPFRIAMRM